MQPLRLRADPTTAPPPAQNKVDKVAVLLHNRLNLRLRYLVVGHLAEPPAPAMWRNILQKAFALSDGRDED